MSSLTTSVAPLEKEHGYGQYGQVSKLADVAKTKPSAADERTTAEIPISASIADTHITTGMLELSQQIKNVTNNVYVVNSSSLATHQIIPVTQ